MKVDLKNKGSALNVAKSDGLFKHESASFSEARGQDRNERNERKLSFFQSPAQSSGLPAQLLHGPQRIELVKPQEQCNEHFNEAD
jgi:hypothetical protein